MFIQYVNKAINTWIIVAQILSQICHSQYWFAMQYKPLTVACHIDSEKKTAKMLMVEWSIR